jgi:DNA-binding MarR family transcriptional regulator
MSVDNKRTRRVTYTERDQYLLFPTEREIYHTIFKETILKNRRCTELSLTDLVELTGIKKSTVDYQLKNLQRKRLIEIDRSSKTNKICIVTLYKEIYGR